MNENQCTGIRAMRLEENIKKEGVGTDGWVQDLGNGVLKT